MPENLEYLNNSTARSLMSFYTMLVYVFGTISAVIYSGALALNTIFDLKASSEVRWPGGVVIGITQVLYIIFW